MKKIDVFSADDCLTAPGKKKRAEIKIITNLKKEEDKD